MKTTFLNKIAQQPKFGTGTCLERVTLAMNALVSADFLQSTPSVVLTGTNGKGSTAMLFEALSRAFDINTALFTSPHFVEFNERFQINRQSVDYAQLNHTLDVVLAVTNPISAQTQQQFGVFDILFLLALKLFSQQNIDLMIFEAGIGGRYDPVRVLNSKLTALTSLDLEHTDLLGDSLELIAYDKLDACAPGGTVVLGNIDAQLIDKITRYATAKNISIVLASDRARIKTLDHHPHSQADGYNLQTAMALCLLHFNPHFNPTPRPGLNHALKCAVEHCQLPGRFEQIATNPTVIVDAAHTPQAFKLLFNSIKQQYKDEPCIFILAMAQGREVNVVKMLLAQFNSSIIITRAFKGQAPHTLFKALEQPNAIIEPDMPQALKIAKQLAIQQQATVFVVGSLFLAGQITAIERNIDYQRLYLY